MRVQLNSPTFGPDEIAAAVEVMQSTFVTQGSKVAEFEEAFADKTGFQHAVAVNSGSSANLLAVSALKTLGAFKAGDEVLVPALTWPTTIWPLVQHNLVPVFMDCDLDTLNIYARGHTGRGIKSARAIIAVPVYGNTLRAIIDRKVTMYDCCEALGTPKPDCDVATYSFYFSHHITTFEGGMVCTDNEHLADMLRIQRSHGWIRDVKDKQKYIDTNPEIDPRFMFVELGYNLRMTDVAAAVGLVQLPKLDGFVKRRQINHRVYEVALREFTNYLRFQSMNSGSSCFSFAITVKEDAPFDVKALSFCLTHKGIENRPIIAGNMARQPGMLKHKFRTIGELPNANAVMDRGLSIGNHQDMGPAEIEYVAGVIGDFMEQTP